MKKLIVVLLILVLFVLPVSVSATMDETPTKIIIPSLNLSLPVHKAKIIFNTWEVHLDGASFGDGTTLPGNLGNMVIFSHARIGLFSNLPTIKKGALIHVFTKDDWFTYQVIDTFIVSPDRVDVLDSKNQYELTLYTCTGSNYSQRFIVKAKILSNPAYLQ
jgi:LPXTG-site transpeptidase (sortase) family protein